MLRYRRNENNSGNAPTDTATRRAGTSQSGESSPHSKEGFARGYLLAMRLR